MKRVLVLDNVVEECVKEVFEETEDIYIFADGTWEDKVGTIVIPEGKSRIKIRLDNMASGCFGWRLLDDEDEVELLDNQ